MLEFRILGPLEILDDGRPILIRPPKLRALLMLLTLHAGEVVSTDRLIDDLWAGHPPATAKDALHNYVSRLRRSLGRDVVVTARPGYRLDLKPDQIDRSRFERLLEEARAGGTLDQQAAKLREALALWRGPPLADVAYEPFAELEAGRLEELHVTVREDLIDAELELGRRADLVPELEQLVAERPFDERARAQLMLALYRAGRQADALEVYREARELLVDELGLEPSAPLRELERQILRQDPSLERALPLTTVLESRKTVTILFADLVGSSELADALDPESLRQLLDRYFGTVRRAIERHGGVIEKFIGDAVMAIFGVPVAHEDDALRAVRAAVDMRANVAALSAEVERERGLRLEMRIGLNTGEVFVGDPAGVQALATGSAVVFAKRLEQSAGPGEILLGADTLALVRDAVKTIPVRPRPTRPAFLLTELLTGAPAIARYFEAPLAGRQQELGSLRHSYATALEHHHCRVALIVGEPGIGKTRLVRELVAELEEKATVLVGRCVSYGEGATFLPLREMIDTIGRDLSSIFGDDEHADALTQRISELLGLTEGRGSLEEGFWAVRRLCEALAHEKPLALVFEDVHWAEPTLLDLIEHIQEHASGPILLLCATRPELLDERPAWTDFALMLKPLAAKETDLLIAGLPGGSEVSNKLRTRLVEIAEGNPLFAEQLLAHVEERGAPGLDAVPPSLNALLASRLDLLESEQRGLLQRAAVIGREFSRAALSATTPSEAPVLSAQLLELVRRGLVQPTRPRSSQEEPFRFHHVLVRDVAYTSIPKLERANLHVMIADWVEEQPDALDEIVGYHLEQAYRYRAELGPLEETEHTLASRAGTALAQAGLAANQRGDMIGAANLLSRALDLVPRDDSGRGDLLLTLGDCLFHIGNLSEASAVHEDALAAARAAGDRGLAWEVTLTMNDLESRVAPGQRSFEEYLREAERATVELEELGHDRGLARAWFAVARHRLWTGQGAAAAEASERAAVLAQRADDRFFEALGFGILGAALHYGPTPASEGIRRCEEILARTADLITRADIRRFLSGFHAMLGHADEARRLHEFALAEAEDLGLRPLVAAIENLFPALAETFGLAESERCLRHSLAFFEETGNQDVRSTVAAELALVLCRQGCYDEAERYAVSGESSAAPDDFSSRALARAAHARILAHRGDLKRAESFALEAAAIEDRSDDLDSRAWIRMHVAEVLSEVGNAAEACSVLEEAIRLAEMKEDILLLGQARARIAQLQVSARSR